MFTLKRVEPGNICFYRNEEDSMRFDLFEPTHANVVRKSPTTSGGYNDSQNLKSDRQYIVKISK